MQTGQVRTLDCAIDAMQARHKEDSGPLQNWRLSWRSIPSQPAHPIPSSWYLCTVIVIESSISQRSSGSNRSEISCLSDSNAPATHMNTPHLHIVQEPLKHHHVAVHGHLHLLVVDARQVVLKVSARCERTHEDLSYSVASHQVLVKLQCAEG